MSVQTTSLRVGANGCASPASFEQAATRCGSVPAAGAHLNVYVFFPGLP
jgi:hypothetical protein